VQLTLSYGIRVAMAASTFPLLFSPLPLRNLTLKNRIVSTSHDAFFADRGSVGDRYIDYHVAKARGGAGLIQCFGTTSVHPTFAPGPGVIRNWDDTIVPGFRRLADLVHAEGAAITCQLLHGGRRSSSAVTRVPTLSASDEPNDRTGETPRVMTIDDIRMIVDAYAAAAGRTVRAGFDGVEVAVFGDGLPDQFLSPLVNRRTDAYGGDLQNRLRFTQEILEACREAIGPDALLMVRLSADDFQPGELSTEDRIEVAGRLDALGLIDLFSITAGTVKTLLGRPYHVPSAYFPHAVYLDVAARIKRRIRAPMLYAGRVVHPHEAEAALRQGSTDLVGMTRAIIADPDMPKKAREGRLAEIRPCVGANEGCIGRLYQGLPIECVHNPAIGREAELGPVIAARQKRRVVVVGAGPAGLETARMSALRGHDVTVLEMRARAGGQVRIAALAPERGEVAGIVDWLESECKRLGVDLRLGIEAGSDEVLELRPEVVVVATGSLARPLPSIVAAGAAVVDVRAAMEGAPLGRRVVVYAEDPLTAGPTCADLLAARGHEVTVVAPQYVVGEMIDDTVKPIILRRLLDAGVTLLPLHRVVAYEVGRVAVQHVLTGKQRSLEADSAVVAAAARSNADLASALRGKVAEVHLVGDAVAPRRIHDAILEGTRAARVI
jgi:2,4-dienoyl-CoA reductase-like NADH-dependent reductase (Old Yellow Enzyme family)